MNTVWWKAVLAAAGACALTALAGCDNGPSAVESRAERSERPAYEETFERGQNGRYAERRSERAEAPDRARAETPLYAGRPLWSANRRYDAEENARRHFAKNGEALGAKSYDDFLRKVHGFVDSPPAGTQRLTRPANGDVLLYHAGSNTFAVVTRDGAPRTMFKPDDGAEYWARQKALVERGGRRERENPDRS